MRIEYWKEGEAVEDFTCDEPAIEVEPNSWSGDTRFTLQFPDSYRDARDLYVVLSSAEVRRLAKFLADEEKRSRRDEEG